MAHDLFNNILIILLACIIITAICQRIHLPVIIGYIIVGILVGPSGIGLISSSEVIKLLAEFGIVFLMFMVGLEFSITHLLRLKKDVFVFGGLQVLLSILVTLAIGLFFKMTASQSFIVGAIVAMSSTAIVIKQLTEQLEINSPYSQHAMGILLFQDLAVIPILILLPTLADLSMLSFSNQLGLAILKGAATILVILFVGKRILKPIFYKITGLYSLELFTLTTLSITLLCAGLTAYVGLSYSLGAFLAGMMLGETEFRHQIKTDIRPFKDVLLGFFFVIGDEILVYHPDHLDSIDFIRGKIYGHELNKNQIHEIMKDVVAGSLSDIHIAAFLAATGDGRLTQREIQYLTESMIEVGNRITWERDLIVDKHCVGGLPGNRTTPIVVSIVAAFGLTFPKTSSRAITSPAGTADTMEVFTPVELDLPSMRKVVEKESGCVIWGGSVNLSPADDILIRIERSLILDSVGQLVASILSKKIAAGSSHVLIDIPIGPTVKVRTMESANELKNYLQTIGKTLGIEVQTMFTDGTEPVGRGIGPALEAKDILAVLQLQPHAPQNLKERSLQLAAQILEFSPKVKKGTGYELAAQILNSGQAWQKFQAICYAQGGFSEPTTAIHQHTISSTKQGIIQTIDNRYLSQIAKFAGAPQDKAAGVELLAPIGTKINKGDPLFVIHAENKGELHYAVNFLNRGFEIFGIGEST